MNIVLLPDLLRYDTCPFTGKQYDCAHCDYKPAPPRSVTPGGKMMHHFSLCITHPIDGRWWKGLLKWFDQKDRQEAKRVIGELLNLGATCLPVGDCDILHFCFRHGYAGHIMKNEGDGGIEQ